jgi:hypothetical protein
MPTRRDCCALAALLMTGCGYVGDPLPPLLNIPGRVTDLRVIERAERIVVEFTVPELTTEGMPLKLGSVDLRAGPPGPEPFDAEVWAAGAKRLDTSGAKPGPVRVEFPALGWNGAEVFVRVRILSDRGKDGGWTDFAILRVIAPLERPSGLKAEAVAEGVRLAWSGPRRAQEVRFRVRRRSGTGAAAEVATVSGAEWLDRGTRYGESYEYWVQAVVNAGGANAESEISEAATVQPVDKFAPATPAGVTVLAGPASIELTWDRNTEADLAGYYLYRAAGDGAFERIGALLTTPNYSDTQARPGVRHRYAASSVDQLGNQSGRSAPVEMTLP